MSKISNSCSKLVSAIEDGKEKEAKAQLFTCNFQSLPENMKKTVSMYHTRLYCQELNLDSNKAKNQFCYNANLKDTFGIKEGLPPMEE